MGFCGGMNLKENDWDTRKHRVFEPRRARFGRPKSFRERVIELLIRQVRALPCALVMATHSEAIAERADRILDLGRLRG